MRKIIKIFLSFLLIYEPLIYFILADDYGTCRDLLTRSICNADSRFFWFMILPIIFMAIYLMWEKQIKSIFKKKHTKHRILRNQRFIYPLEAFGRFVTKGLSIRETATRSEFWCFFLPYLIISSFLFAFFTVYNLNTVILDVMFFIIIPIPLFTLCVRRWNDLGLNGVVIEIIRVLISLPCLLGFIMATNISDLQTAWLLLKALLIFGGVTLFLFCFSSTFENNKYRNKQQDLTEGVLSDKVIKKIYKSVDVAKGYTEIKQPQTDYDDEDD